MKRVAPNATTTSSRVQGDRRMEIGVILIPRPETAREIKKARGLITSRLQTTKQRQQALQWFAALGVNGLRALALVIDSFGGDWYEEWVLGGEDVQDVIAEHTPTPEISEEKDDKTDYDALEAFVTGCDVYPEIKPLPAASTGGSCAGSACANCECNETSSPIPGTNDECANGAEEISQMTTATTDPNATSPTTLTETNDLEVVQVENPAEVTEADAAPKAKKAKGPTALEIALQNATPAAPKKRPASKKRTSRKAAKPAPAKTDEEKAAEAAEAEKRAEQKAARDAEAAKVEGSASAAPERAGTSESAPSSRKGKGRKAQARAERAQAAGGTKPLTDEQRAARQNRKTAAGGTSGTHVPDVGSIHMLLGYIPRSPEELQLAAVTPDRGESEIRGYFCDSDGNRLHPIGATAQILRKRAGEQREFVAEAKKADRPVLSCSCERCAKDGVEPMQSTAHDFVVPRDWSTMSGENNEKVTTRSLSGFARHVDCVPLPPSDRKATREWGQYIWTYEKLSEQETATTERRVTLERAAASGNAFACRICGEMHTLSRTIRDRDTGADKLLPSLFVPGDEAMEFPRKRMDVTKHAVCFRCRRSEGIDDQLREEQGVGEDVRVLFPLGTALQRAERRDRSQRQPHGRGQQNMGDAAAVKTMVLLFLDESYTPDADTLSEWITGGLIVEDGNDYVAGPALEGEIA